MHTPRELVTLCGWFDQDFDWGDETGEQAVEAAIANANLSAAELNVVSAYLDELLSGKYSNGDLSSIWRKTGAELRLGSRKSATKFPLTMRSVFDSFDSRSVH